MPTLNYQHMHYNFAYLDETTKKMIRRALLKGVAIPGFQVPFGGREMPMPYGWGTGGIQVTASILAPTDTLKVIDIAHDDAQRIALSAGPLNLFVEFLADDGPVPDPRQKVPRRLNAQFLPRLD